MKATFLSALLLIIAGLSAEAAEVTITLPPEAGVLREAKGVEAANANCVTCHSAEYVATQPRMPKKFWEATVKKMREKFGAPITDDTVPIIVEYLATAYGTEAK